MSETLTQAEIDAIGKRNDMCELASAFTPIAKTLREAWQTIEAMKNELARVGTQRDVSASEVAACLGFLSAEMQFEAFRLDYFCRDDEKKRIATDENVRKLQNFMLKTGRGLQMWRRVTRAEAQLQAIREAAGPLLFLIARMPPCADSDAVSIGSHFAASGGRASCTVADLQRLIAALAQP